MHSPTSRPLGRKVSTNCKVGPSTVTTITTSRRFRALRPHSLPYGKLIIGAHDSTTRKRVHFRAGLCCVVRQDFRTTNRSARLLHERLLDGEHVVHDSRRSSLADPTATSRFNHANFSEAVSNMGVMR